MGMVCDEVGIVGRWGWCVMRWGWWGGGDGV